MCQGLASSPRPILHHERGTGQEDGGVSAWVPPPKMAGGTAPSSYTTCKAATGRRSWMVAMGLLPCNGECTGAGQGLPAHTPFWS